MPPTSAPGAVITVITVAAAVAAQQRPLSPVLSAPGWRSPLPRTGGPIMTIIMAVPAITAAAPITAAGMVTGAVTAAGNRRSPNRLVRRSPCAAGGFLD